MRAEEVLHRVALGGGLDEREWEDVGGSFECFFEERSFETRPWDFNQEAPCVANLRFERCAADFVITARLRRC